MTSESIKQTAIELKTAVSELTRNCSHLAASQTNLNRLHMLSSLFKMVRISYP